MTSNRVPFYAVPFLMVVITVDCLACWNHIPLERVIENAHVVVIGSVDRVDLADPPPQADEYGTDTAYIRVSSVLKNTLSDFFIAENDVLPLSMPSVLNKVPLSTDIRFKEGQTGIWILSFRNGFFTASYPKDFQPLSSKRRVLRIVHNAPSPYEAFTFKIHDNTNGVAHPRSFHHDAYELGLSYLVSKQNPDGSWGSPTGTVYKTAFALLAFLNHGERTTSSSYGNVLRDGLRWLVRQEPSSQHDQVYLSHVLYAAYQIAGPMLRLLREDTLQTIEANHLPDAHAVLYAITPRPAANANHRELTMKALYVFRRDTDDKTPLAIYLGGMSAALNDPMGLNAFNRNLLTPLLTTQKEDGSFSLKNADTAIESTSFALLYMSIYYRCYWLYSLNSIY